MAEFMRIDRRQQRVQVLLHTILHIVSKYVREDDEQDCLRELHYELAEALGKAGVEILTDDIRAQIGLPPRGPDGWTVEEIIELERRRLELMRAPTVVMR